MAASAPGELSLPTLLSTMTPTLDTETTYVWGTIPAHTPEDYSNILRLFVGLPVQHLFRETEGWTVVVPQHVAAEIQMQATFPCKMVTLNVHSSLDAVGFLAAITARLAANGVSANAVSGFYHDHLFVKVGVEGDIMEILKNMVEEAKKGVEGGKA